MTVYNFGFWFLILFNHGLALEDDNSQFKISTKEIRNQLLKKAEENSSLLNPNDVKYLKEDDWPSLSFLIDNNNDKDRALNKLVESFAWRNSMLPRNMDYFPAELHRSRVALSCGKSIAGRPLYLVKLSRVPLADNMILLAMKFYARIFDNLERQKGDNGIDYIFDFDGFSTANFNMKMLKIVFSWSDYFPEKAPKNFYFYRFPPANQALLGTIKGQIPRKGAEAITVVEDEKQMERFVNPDQLARDFGGTNECKTNTPATAESGICQLKFNYITEDDWRLFYKQAKEEFKLEANYNGFKSVADMFLCKNGNSTANEIIKKLVES